MFPLKANDPYIKATGERSTLGSVVGGGSDTPELPDYGIADAGKVLTVADDGSLEWDARGEGGGGVILGYVESFTASGSHTFTDTVTITETGNYLIVVGGFLSTATVKINDVAQENTFEENNVYCHYYYSESKELSQGDVIDISLVSSGKTMFVANIIKLAN